MKEKIYTIKNLCNELNQPRQKVRRRIEKLDIKAINEDTRIHENEPLEYDHQAFLKLAKEFDVKINNTECTASVQQRTASVQQRTANEQHRTAEETSKDKLIKVLEKQLEEANKSRANLEKLLDQQQQLTLISNKELESLKLEFEVKEQLTKKQEKKWYQIFKR